MVAILSCYRVLDLTDEKSFLCGKVLGDLGADVIKIEQPGGDPGRSKGPFYHDIPDPEKSLYWFAFNANKRGITLNIETSDGREIDLLLETEKGFIPIEVKQAGTVNTTDARHLIDVGQILDKPVIHSFVLSNDIRVRSLGAGITAMPAAWFLS